MGLSGRVGTEVPTLCGETAKDGAPGRLKWAQGAVTTPTAESAQP